MASSTNLRRPLLNRRRRSRSACSLARGWHVQRAKVPDSGIDLLMDRNGVSYAVEMKASREGRSDRLIQLWSQAWLQAQQGAGNRKPLAVVAAPKIPLRSAQNVLRFVERYVPDAAAGVMDFAGLCHFHGPHLEDLNSESNKRLPRELPENGPSSNLFSDLNQWMLKVLLAPELPDHLLAAPQGQVSQCISDRAGRRGFSNECTPLREGT